MNNLIRNEAMNKTRREQAFAEEDLTGRQMWSRVKKLAGWSSSLSPTIFTTDTGLITKPKLMADHINGFFCEKIKNICDSLSKKDLSDPLVLLKMNFKRWKNKDKVEKLNCRKLLQRELENCLSF